MVWRVALNGSTKRKSRLAPASLLSSLGAQGTGRVGFEWNFLEEVYWLGCLDAVGFKAEQPCPLSLNLVCAARVCAPRMPNTAAPVFNDLQVEGEGASAFFTDLVFQVSNYSRYEPNGELVRRS